MLSFSDRQQRWISAVLVLGALVLAMVAVSLAASVFFAFGDVILVFFLAWLLAFILSPVVGGLVRLIPVLPRVGAVVTRVAGQVTRLVELRRVDEQRRHHRVDVEGPDLDGAG